MITIIDGVPGAGKTYFLVREIARKVHKYYKIYTNVNEFKFDRFENVYPFKVMEFTDIMIRCKRIYDDDSKTDKDILAYLVSIDFLNDVDNPKPVFVVVDEVHNILGKASELWTWILTYHRHLYIDFLFATQDYTLIYNKYYKLFQKVYRALPNSRSFHFRSNRYQEHLKLPISDGKTGTFLRNLYVKKEQQYYDLYKAGDAVRAKSVFARFIWLFVVLAIALVAFFSLFIYHLTGGRSSQSSSVSSESNVTHSPIHYVSRSSFSSGKYIYLDCYLDKCVYPKFRIEINLDDVQRLLQDTDSMVLSYRRYSKDRLRLYLVASPEFLDLFQFQRGKDETGFLPFR